MDTMYWEFEGIIGEWSVAAGNTTQLVDRVGRKLTVQRWESPSTPLVSGAGGSYIAGKRIPPRAPEVPGAKKYDGDKPMMDLLIDGCPGALLSVGEVLTYGYKKYGGKHGWKALPDARKRYEAAMLRHQLLLASGEVVDQESGLPHAAHIACNALFLLQFHTEDK